MNIKFDGEPVYCDNDKYIKTKINTCEDKVNKNFQGKTTPKENGSYKCLSLIMLDSVIRANDKYYPRTLLKECKYDVKKNKMENLINDDLDPSSLMNLVMNLIIDLIMNLIMMNLMINLLKDKTGF